MAARQGGTVFLGVPTCNLGDLGDHNRMTWKRVYSACLFLLFALSSVQAQQIETAQETNERIHNFARAFLTQPGDYVIGSSDLIRVEVFDVPELSREVRVSESGYVSLPLLPVRVRAAGLTAFQLEEKIAELLQVNGLVSSPQVSIFIKEQHSHPITVIGAVRTPLVHQAIRQTTLLEILSLAGGIADDAGSIVIVTRSRPGTDETAAAPEPETYVIELRDLLESGDPKYNIPLVGGDFVSVPRGGIVYVAGAVTRPGGFVLQSSSSQEMTTLKAVALAQGLATTARAQDAVILRRDPESGENREIEINLRRVMERKDEDVRLLANDILFVPDSSGKRVLRRVTEAGIAIASSLIIFRVGR
jgi:polysaccharide export outer membrane protein